LVRVAVRLASADDGSVLWPRDRNGRALGDVFALQDEIARDMVAGLRVNLSGDRVRPVGGRHTDNVEACEQAITEYQKAVALSGGSSLALAGLGHAYELEVSQSTTFHSARSSAAR
jgi:hypothetical protein